MQCVSLETLEYLCEVREYKMNETNLLAMRFVGVDGAVIVLSVRVSAELLAVILA